MKRNGTIDAMGLAVVFGVMLWMLSLCRCTPSPDAPPPTPTCEGACKVLAPESESNPWGLGCPEGEPSPERGVPCERWCTDYHALGYLKPWDACVAASTSVTEVRACGVRCER